MKAIDFESITLRQEVSSRGGGIEINLTTLGFEGEKMAAYQNYLGGGLLGSIQVNDTIRRQTMLCDEDTAVKLDEIGEQLKKYFHSLTNPDTEFEGMSYEQNQNMPASGY